MPEYDRFIIALPSLSPGAPIKAGPFIRNSRFDAHVYEGKAFPLDQFNEIVGPVVERYKDYGGRAPVPVLLEKDSTRPAFKPRATPATPRTRPSPPLSLPADVVDAVIPEPDPEPAPKPPAKKAPAKKAARPPTDE